MGAGILRSLLLVGLMPCGCIQVIQPPTQAPQIQAPATAYPPAETAAFGIITMDAAGEPRFVQTESVPNVEGQTYGWFVWVGELNHPVGWTEIFTLPSSPSSWGEAESAPNVSISPDGRTAITQKQSIPERGFIFNVWSVAAGDPVGEYTIEVAASTGHQQRFRFSVHVPTAAEASRETTLSDAVRACNRIQAAAEIPIECTVDYIQGAPSMVVGFRNIDEIAGYWEPMADHVAGPFCTAANSANRQAFVFVIVGARAARPFLCELDKWGEWFDLETDEESL